MFVNWKKTYDYIFDIAITPNRGDCASYIGVAREIAVANSLAHNLPDNLASDINKINPEEKLAFLPSFFEIKPNYEWAGRPITDKDYLDHLAGKKSIGIQPCRIDKTVQFGCIDVDPPDYGAFKIEKYLALIQQHKLPIVPILSKSGGLHCYVFLKEPIPTIDLIEALKAFLLPLGLKPATEVFPKQKELQKDDKGDIKPGNFINLPYYNNGGSNRYAIDTNNSKLSIEEFIKFANESKVDNTKLNELIEETHRNILLGTDPEFEDGPPCLALCSLSKLEDGRDRYMYNYMVFAKKKYYDNWEDKVKQAAREYFIYDQKWDDNYVDFKIKGWKKETKGHLCNEEPIVNFCMKSECIKRKFGIASDRRKAFPALSGLQKINYRPDPEYTFNVACPDGEKVKQVHAKSIEYLTDQRKIRNSMDYLINYLKYMKDKIN
mgnify:CR=1 FL=1